MKATNNCIFWENKNIYISISNIHKSTVLEKKNIFFIRLFTSTELEQHSLKPKTREKWKSVA